MMSQLSGLVSVVFVFKSPLNMVAPLSKCPLVEQRAVVYLFLVVRRHYNILNLYGNVSAVW